MIYFPSRVNRYAELLSSFSEGMFSGVPLDLTLDFGPYAFILAHYLVPLTLQLASAVSPYADPSPS